jgi:hypothetical protein
MRESTSPDLQRPENEAELLPPTRADDGNERSDSSTFPRVFISGKGTHHLCSIIPHFSKSTWCLKTQLVAAGVLVAAFLKTNFLETAVNTTWQLVEYVIKNPFPGTKIKNIDRNHVISFYLRG